MVKQSLKCQVVIFCFRVDVIMAEVEDKFKTLSVLHAYFSFN